MNFHNKEYARAHSQIGEDSSEEKKDNSKRGMNSSFGKLKEEEAEPHRRNFFLCLGRILEKIAVSNSKHRIQL
jgi:hypothetical protein